MYKPFRIFLLILLLQACNSITGPVHFYPGQSRTENETARINFPAEITVLKIDGKDVKVPSIEEGYYEVYLLPGVHRVDFKYELAWGDNTNGMLIKSDIVGVETRFYAGMQYELVYTKPGGLEEAYEMIMASKFTAKLVEKKTGRQVLSRDTSELDDFRITPRDSSGSHLAAEKPESMAPVGMDADTATREDAVKRLKFWWLMANEQERKYFTNWIKQVEGVEKTKIK